MEGEFRFASTSSRKQGSGLRLGENVTIRAPSVAAQDEQVRCQAKLALMPFCADFGPDYRLFFGFSTGFSVLISLVLSM